jgi:hypothetical protein
MKSTSHLSEKHKISLSSSCMSQFHEAPYVYFTDLQLKQSMQRRRRGHNKWTGRNKNKHQRIRTNKNGDREEIVSGRSPWGRSLLSLQEPDANPSQEAESGGGDEDAEKGRNETGKGRLDWRRERGRCFPSTLGAFCRNSSNFDCPAPNLKIAKFSVHKF